MVESGPAPSAGSADGAPGSGLAGWPDSLVTQPGGSRNDIRPACHSSSGRCRSRLDEDGGPAIASGARRTIGEKSFSSILRQAFLDAFALLSLLLVLAAQSFYRLIVPWSRPALDRASEYVLRHRRPTDLVIGNVWEAAYYFRHLGQSYWDFEVGPIPRGERVWVVLVSTEEQERQRLVGAAARREAALRSGGACWRSDHSV